MRARAWYAVAAGAAALQLSCAPPDAEQELRALVTAAEAAAEDRDTGHFRGLVSTNYSDARGNGRDDVIAMLRGYFLTHAGVEVVTRVDEVLIEGGDAARVAVHVALVGQVGGRSLLAGFDGELERLELELVREEGDWRIIGADWAVGSP